MQMEINRCTKEAFSVIGKEGSTNDGIDFILNGLSLAGAAHDFNCPETGQGYMFFPIK